MQKRVLYTYAFICLFGFLAACDNNSDAVHAGHEQEKEQPVYTCPMHPEISRTAAGSCPVCSMDLVKSQPAAVAVPAADISLNSGFVVSTVPVISMEQRSEAIELNVPGTVTYDPRQAAAISSRVNGRIERLYIRYKYQPIKKGQRIMDIYSPDLVSVQQNLIFLLRNDPGNISLINATKDRLILMGMSRGQVAQLTHTKRLQYSVPVFSAYNGFATDANMNAGDSRPDNMQPPSFESRELNVKEGMYVQSGQSVFSVYNPSRAWILLDVFPEQQTQVRTGNSVTIVPETAPHQSFSGRIDYIEPIFRQGAKTVSARVYFNNASMRLPIGSRVTAHIFPAPENAYWLPKEAVLSLGRDHIVFTKEKAGFRAHRVNTGLERNRYVQIVSGLNKTDSVAANAQFLVDNESFIKTNEP